MKSKLLLGMLSIGAAVYVATAINFDQPDIPFAAGVSPEISPTKIPGDATSIISDNTLCFYIPSPLSSSASTALSANVPGLIVWNNPLNLIGTDIKGIQMFWGENHLFAYVIVFCPDAKKTAVISQALKTKGCLLASVSDLKQAIKNKIIAGH